jgi:spore coat polysaccharide biosynthesis protein SpsF (cytidylyltransferase family)
MPGAGPGHQERNPEVEQMERRQAEARNDERQKQLVKDTDKLFALASELHDEVSKTNKDMLSIEVIKKADEIQKLAKSVRDKMKAD